MGIIVPDGTPRQDDDRATRRRARAKEAAARIRREVDDNVLATPCSACGAQAGVRCTTFIEGVDMGWPHDVRFYEVNGWRHEDERPGGTD